MGRRPLSGRPSTADSHGITIVAVEKSGRREYRVRHRGHLQWWSAAKLLSELELAGDAAVFSELIQDWEATQLQPPFTPPREPPPQRAAPVGAT
eukprot:COSAG01_NODE_6155_length_3820_cov_23.261758_3_plen_94_part_00